MDGTLVALLFAGLVVVGIVAGVVVTRSSGPRPDAPLKGADDGDRTAAQEGSQWKADRPGGPGQESEHAVPGDATPGGPGDDEPGRDG